MDMDTLDRLMSNVRPFPLPEHMTPMSGIPLQDIDDELLMTAPPHLIAHIQRTASQGGLQVISPRQTPFSALMIRTTGGARQLGDHVVGSIADPRVEWPTIDGSDLSQLLPDEPLPTASSDQGIRAKTKTEPISRAGRLLSDPILSCLVKGRAVIDILRRSDVTGGAEVMTRALANAWGISVQDMEDLDAFTLGVDGPLLRHAIKADEVYPMNYAPTHIKRVVSMGVSEVTRDLLPDDSAMDWRRMRVFCEAVFILSCTIEGIPIKMIRALPPPGDPVAPTNRPGVMVFQPAPATAWTFEPQTFSIYPRTTEVTSRRMGVPREVYEALARYTAVVRPVSYAMAMGHRAVAKRSLMVEANVPLGETVSESYRLLARAMLVGSARGRTAAATVRNAIYRAVEAAPFSTRLRIVRYLTIARDECKKHLDLTEVPDLLVDKIAVKFGEIGSLIRLTVVAEAARRGATAEEWWSDIVAQAPDRYKMLTEGTHGWSRIGMWLIFRAPTDRWDKLVKAAHYNALRDAEKGAIGAMPLPAEVGSIARLMAAARAAMKGITRAYSGYYIGVADVGLALADVAASMGRGRTADILREAAYLWVLRARCFRGTNVSPITGDEPTVSLNHYRIPAEPSDLVVKPAPYMAFHAYVNHAEESAIIPTVVKTHLRNFRDPKVSEAFITLNRPICMIKKTVLTSFLVDPPELGHAMERAWQEITGDMAEVVRRYAMCIEPRAPVSNFPDLTIPMQSGLVLKLPVRDPTKRDYFEVMTELEDDELDWVDSVMDRMGPEFSDMIMEMRYEDVSELRRVLLNAEKEAEVSVKVGVELVR